MKKYTPLIAIAGTLILVIIGGVILYRTFGDLLPGQQLQVVATPTPGVTPPPDSTPPATPPSVAESTNPEAETPATTPATTPTDASTATTSVPTSDPSTPADPGTTAEPDTTADTATETSPSDTVPEPQVLDFTVYDADRNPVRLTDYVGTPIVLNFWASWCPPCRVEMPYFQEVYEELGDEVHFLMINQTDGTRETKELADAFIAEDGYTFPVLFDHDMDAAIAYGIRALPSTFFIGEDGIVVAYAYGGISKEQLHEGIGYIRD